MPASCYRVWLRDPSGSQQTASPMIVALSMDEAVDKALGILPGYEVLNAVLEHPNANHGHVEPFSLLPAGPPPDQPRHGMRLEGD